MSPRLRIPPALAGTAALVRLLPRISRTRAAWGLAGLVVVSLLPTVVAVATGLLIGAVPDALRDGLSSPAGRHLFTLLGFTGALVVLQQCLPPLVSALADTLGRDADRFLQQEALAAVGRPDRVDHLSDPGVLAALRVVRGLGVADNGRPSQAVAALAYVLPAWLRALTGAAVLLAFHWWLGLLWLAAWPLAVHFMQREYFRVGELAFGRSKALEEAEYLRDLAVTAGPAKELRLWGLLEWLTARFETTWRSAMEPVWRGRRPRARLIAATTGMLGAVNLLSYGLLAWAAAHHHLGLAAIAVYTQALALANNYTAFDDQNAQLAFAAAAVPHVLALGDRAEDDPQPGPAQPGSARPAPPPAEAIRYRAVALRYPGTDRSALRRVDLTIPVGRSLAIVGDNGAGKSSLVKLLCGLHAPTAGRIEVDGRDLRDIDPRQWRRHVSVLFQDFARYHLSAADNITLGAPHRAADRDLMRAAADSAGILPLIESLPHGWDTVLSPGYTGGTDLSGGQWQRVALARALFAVQAGARVLVLDEPTAALDIRAEAEIYDRFLDLTAGLTTVLISHRFSTVRRVDRIVVLDHGEVAEEGSHDELMLLGGTYARMFRIQAERFARPESPESPEGPDDPGSTDSLDGPDDPGSPGAAPVTVPDAVPAGDALDAEAPRA
ncbi:ABC transporter ATP-binding protein [Actinacidiphila epipremni]|uniref:ABC transporter ATP-binding protein n=1 Tax=Actinacidiphila epipremni TaxID=2053013 RepID=A0ABX0ZIJ3_9ACTN|nr:ABC transporter ATP-binding protein [Actinacidiphila epipremni]NJP43585.1 ABC transporter ATP-binding protein [Actinacidiphila epipremni]